MNAKTFFKRAASVVLAGAAALSMTVFVGADGAATTATTTPTAASMKENSVYLDGVRSEAEGWTKQPQLTVKKDGFKAELNTWIGTDGKNLYYFIEVTDRTSLKNGIAVFVDYENLHVDYNTADAYRTMLDAETTIGSKSVALNFLVNGDTYTIYNPNTTDHCNDGTTSNTKTNRVNYVTCQDNWGLLAHAVNVAADYASYSIEFSIPLPADVQTALKSGSYTIGSETIGYGGWCQAALYDDSVMSADKKSIEPAKAHDVILPQTQTAETTVAIAANMIGKTVTLNGTRTAEEGWTVQPTLVADDNQSALPTYLWLGTDGTKIYGFVEGSRAYTGLLDVCLKFTDTATGKTESCHPRFVNNRGKWANSNGGEIFVWGPKHELSSWSNFAVSGKYSMGKYEDVFNYEFSLALPSYIQEGLKNGTVTIGADMDSSAKGSWNLGNQKEKGTTLAYGGSTSSEVLRSVTLPSTNVELIGMQMGEMDGKGAVRFVSALYQTVDYTAYSEIGFNLTLNGKTVSKNCTEVYNAISANYGAAQVTAASQGAKYLYAITLTGLEYDKEYVLTVQPWAKTADGKTVTGVAYTISVVVAAPGQSAQGASISANNDPVACNLANELAASQGWTVSEKKTAC